MYKKLMSVIYLLIILFPFAVSAAPATPGYVNVSVNVDDITISWGASSGATKYVREARVGSGPWINPKEYEGTSVTFRNVAPNTYQYRVKACNTNSCSSWKTSTTVRTGKPLATGKVTAELQQNVNVKITWERVTGADYYIREARIGAGAWIHPNEYRDTSVSFYNLSPNVYRYRVKACNHHGCSVWKESNSIKVERIPSAPSSVSGSIVNGNDVRVQWAESQGAIRYILQSQSNGQNWQNLGSDTSLSYTVKNVPYGTFKFRVKACSGRNDATGCSLNWAESAEIEVARLSPPLDVKATVANGNDITVSWQGVSLAPSYIREVTLDGGRSWINRKVYNKQNELNTYKATYFNVDSGTYQYRVTACREPDGKNCLEQWTLSNLVAFSYIPPAPSSVSGYVVNDNDVRVKWASSKGAKRYILQSQSNGQKWGNSKSHTSLSHTVKDLPYGTSKFRVKACSGWKDATDCSLNWAESAEIEVTRLSPPLEVKATVANGNDITLEWQGNSAAQSYIREVTLDGGKSWINAKFYNKQNEQNTYKAAYFNVDSGTYQYRVTACQEPEGKNCLEQWTLSNVLALSYVPPAPSSVSGSVVNDNDVRVQWAESKGAKRYILQSQSNGQTWQNLGSDTSLSYTVKNVPYGTFKLRVKACSGWNDAIDCSLNWAESSIITIIYRPKAPASVSASVESGNNIKLSWTVSENAESYLREVKVGGGKWINSKVYYVSDFEQPDAPEVSFNGVSTNTYRYKVKACVGSGENRVCSNDWTYSNAVEVRAPVTLSVDLANKQLSWTAAPEAQSYRLEQANCERCTVSQQLDWQSVNDALSTLTYDIPEADMGKKVYRVKPCFGSQDCAVWSNVVKTDLIKQVIFIHTDLLGNPVAETKELTGERP
ncbi:hypothetical protein ACSLBF_09635 [Pseudoalteromonas sp. T1lg65]|uniref:hypothetical protein n=1 Tax=Pseudoalteromonas sp. T1lg65 TaxID=2077101 RepID=UPI003F7A7982